MDCRNCTWSLQPTHLNSTEKDTQEASQKVRAGRVGCALPQQEGSEIATDCSLCAKPQNWNPRSLAAMLSTPDRAQQELELLFLNSEKPLPVIADCYGNSSNSIKQPGSWQYSKSGCDRDPQSSQAARGVVHSEETSIFSAFSHLCMPFRHYKLPGVICFLLIYHVVFPNIYGLQSYISS